MLKQVDLDQQHIIFAGIRMQGFADGDAATVEFSGQAWTFKMGADGLSVRSKNFDRSAILTVRLMRGSPVNDLLSAIFLSDYKSSNGLGIGGAMIKDLQGTTLLTSQNAYIENPPNLTIAGDNATPMEWKIRLVELDGIWGGN